MVRLTPQPIHRGQLRRWLGARYFTARRCISWWAGDTKFAGLADIELPETWFCHQTPLLRQLKNVDMYLQYNKIANLRLAVPRVNGVLLRPGETFSYWKLIGNPTKRKGYLPGMILQNGGFKAGTGGGLCQLSNLIYWTALHTPLTVTERHRHGYDVFPDADRSQPFGSGATCFYNYGDLMLRNDSDHCFQLQVELGEHHLRACWLGERAADCRYQVYEKQHLIQAEPWGGYTRHNLLYRRSYNVDGELLADEYITENHAIMMYQPFLEEGKEEAQ